MRLWQVVAGSLRRERGYVATLAVILGLCAALGATALGVNRLLLFKSLPYPSEASLYEFKIFLVRGEGEVAGAASPVAAVVREAVPAVASTAFASYTTFRARLGDQDLEVHGSRVSPNYLALLGARLVAGEDLAAVAGAGRDVEAAAVISERLQRSLFPTPKAALGKVITVQDHPVEIVGVVSQGFRSPRELTGTEEDLWLGYQAQPDNPAQWKGLSSNTHILVKVADASQVTAVEKQGGAAVVARLRLHNPKLVQGSQGLTVRVVSLRDAVIGESYKAGLGFLAATGALVGLCLSFSGFLVLARLGRLRSALAVHMMLGARRKHLLYLLGLELGLVLVLSTAAGLLLGALAIRSIRQLGSDLLPRLVELELGSEYALMVLLVAVLALAVLALPVGRLLRRHQLLLRGSGGFKGFVPRHRLGWRRSLLAAQTLLTALGWTIGLVVAVQAVPRLLLPAGFRSDDRYFVQIELPSELRSAAAKDALVPRLQTALRHAGFTTASPVDMPPLSPAVSLFNADDVEGGRTIPMQINGTDADLFKSIELPVLAGSTFTAADYQQKEPVMVVGATLARWLGGYDQALKKTLRYEERPYRVVGVVGDVGNPVTQIPGSENQAYVPFRNYDGVPSLAFIMSTGNSGKMPAPSTVTAAVHGVDEQLFVGDLRPLGQFRDELLAETRFKAGLAIALVLVTFVMTIVCVRTLVSDTYRELSSLLVSHWVVGARQASLRRLLTRSLVIPSLAGIGGYLALGLWGAFRSGLVEQPNRPLVAAGIMGSAAALSALVLLTAYLGAHRQVRSIFSSIGNMEAANPGGLEVSQS
jgi:hypothetical protein